jgi:hypothetical protein
MNKATLIGIGVLLAGFCPAAHGQALPAVQPGQCICYLPIPQAPDAQGPGYYGQNWCGAWYGPNHCVYPPNPPFNGMVFGPPPQVAQAIASGMPPAQAYAMYGQARFPTHPFARGPRDFFMYEAK